MKKGTILLLGLVALGLILYFFPYSPVEYATMADRVQATRAAAHLGAELDTARVQYVPTTVLQERELAEASIHQTQAQAQLLSAQGSYWQAQSDVVQNDVWSGRFTLLCWGAFVVLGIPLAMLLLFTLVQISRAARGAKK